jgi:uncharacterized cupredoxin-like copper-binding protein
VQFARAPGLACAAALIAAAAVALPATGRSSGAAAVRGRSPKTVRVTERDFEISGPKRVAAGDVTLVVRNNGPDQHELIVVRSDGTHLPLRSDGLTVNEERLQKRTIETLEPSPAGDVHRLHLHLAPGRYVLFCNMAGHYLGGMHTALVVR